MFCCITLASGLLLASLNTTPPPGPQDEHWYRMEGETLVLAQPSDSKRESAVSLYDLVNLTRQLTGIDFYLPDHSTEKRLKDESINLFGPKRVEKAKIYDFLQVVLRLHDFACVEIGSGPVKLVRIVALQGPGLQAVKAHAIYVEPDQVARYADRPASLLITLLPLQYIEPQHATQMLSRFFSSQSLEGFAPIGQSSARSGMPAGLMVVGFGPTVHAIQKLLRSLDVPPDPGGSQEILVHCEVWSIAPGEIQARIEKLSAGGERGIETIREILSGGEGCRREMRYRSPVAAGAKTGFKSRAMRTGAAMEKEGTQPPAQDDCSTSLHMRCEPLKGEEARIEFTLSLTSQALAGNRAQAQGQVELESTTTLVFGRMRMFQTTGQSGELVLVLLEISRP